MNLARMNPMLMNAALLAAALTTHPVHADVIGLTHRQGDCDAGMYVARVTNEAGEFEGCWEPRSASGRITRFPLAQEHGGDGVIFVNFYSNSIDFYRDYAPGEIINAFIVRPNGLVEFYTFTAEQVVHMDGTTMDFANTDQ